MAIKDQLHSLINALGEETFAAAMAKANALTKINDPGVRPHRSGEGEVLQFTKRSKQLDSIASETKQLLTDNALDLNSLGLASDMRVVDHGYVILTAKQAHKLKGYMEQVGIIADELKAAGK